jgi:hypothetical protein
MPKGIAAVTEMTRRDSAYLVVIFADGSSAWNTHSAGRMASRRAGARHPRVECESAQMRNRGAVDSGTRSERVRVGTRRWQ